MNNEVKNVIEKFKEVKNKLNKFTERNERVEYLANEIKISKEECSLAYDIIMKIED